MTAPAIRILIAEDEAVTRVRLRAKATHWGYEVVLAVDGEEAWHILQQPDAPRLAILDWMMPGLDGPEICKRVRAQAQEPYIYVLLLTGKGERESIVLGLEAGADDYLTKPFDHHELEVRLRTGVRITGLQRQLVEAREALRVLALFDALTGLVNRPAVLDTLWRELARAERAGTPLSVVIVDIDHFKRVNDTRGHGGGDVVLREVARRMSSAVRPQDAIGRYGGEEFLLVLPGCDALGAAVVAERLRAAVAATPIPLEGGAIEVTCSFGVAAATRGIQSGPLIELADAALYAAKRGGRDRVEVAGQAPALPADVAVLAVPVTESTATPVAVPGAI
jgi:two-component system, cell cycle response regulator